MLRLSGRTIGGMMAIACGAVLSACAYLSAPAHDPDTGDPSKVAVWAERLPELVEPTAAVVGTVGAVVPGAQAAVSAADLMRLYSAGVEQRLAELREDQRATNRDYLLALLGISAAGNGAGVLLNRQQPKRKEESDGS